MRKLVIMIVLALAFCWALVVAFSWQHAYSKAYVDEKLMTGPCSCESTSLKVWSYPDITYRVNGKSLPASIDVTDFSAVEDCINERAQDSAWFAVEGKIVIGVPLAFILLLALLYKEPLPRQD